jgi:hypothetical protein
MKLRKLSAFLLLLVATSVAFAQNADVSVSRKSTSHKSVKSVGKSAKAPIAKSSVVKTPVKVLVDTAKKTAVVAAKIGTDSTKKGTVGSAKTKVDSTIKTATIAVKQTVDSTKKMANAAPKMAADSLKKTGNNATKIVNDAPKKASNETPKAITVALKTEPKAKKEDPSVLTAKSTFNSLTENATVRNASVLNGDKDDFSPIFYENGLLYCSNSKKAAKKADKSAIADDLNLKFAVIDSMGNLSKPGAFSHRANSKTHEGPSCFSTNGDTMFLTRVMSKGGVAKTNKEGETTLKIYIKIRDKEGNFMGDEVMPFESETYSYCHPTISADGQRLYFASNMPGGFGGMDLWMTRKLKTGGWSQAMNLGSRINSAGNELFPNITPSGALYFSSTGRKGNKGGLDMYRVDVENKIAQPFPMGEAFNTEGDDFGIMFLPTNERKGYFSSNRKGGSGGDDIYEFEFK